MIDALGHPFRSTLIGQYLRSGLDMPAVGSGYGFGLNSLRNFIRGYADEDRYRLREMREQRSLHAGRSGYF
jgi:hypothetical protein